MADAIVPITNEQGTPAVDAAQATTAVQGTGGVGAQTTATDTQNGTGNATPVDTAQLSETAQAVLLEQQGLTVSEIADELGIPQTEVESDLGQVAVTQQTPGTGAAASSKVAGA
jgi:hypothetical protein